MPNYLIHSTSPYLLQHANNPVNWYPWSDEALQLARQESKPIFLSIGYAACHWCHVMAHESFENQNTADFLNEHFISIKVDREERPDLDHIYMEAVVALTGQGGWPMSVFLTPDGKPFFAGTYFPDQPRYRIPSFRQVLEGIWQAWQKDPDAIISHGTELVNALHGSSLWDNQSAVQPGIVDLNQAAEQLISNYDWDDGGWGGAPKFPQPMILEFLLRMALRGNHADALRAVTHCLDSMSKGGMFDVIGGGFHRYSTDERWYLPHFEKMLYDNAQLSLVFLHTGMVTGEERFIQIATRTLDYLLREMKHPLGGFFSSQDADSEDEEGKYYFWKKKELREIIQDPIDWKLFVDAYGLADFLDTQEILFQSALTENELAGRLDIPPAEIHDRLIHLQEDLYQIRNRRVHPDVDKKILVAWNGLAIKAFAEAARYLNRADFLEAAQKCAGFIRDHMVKDHVLYRSWKDGVIVQPAFLEDYASLSIGLITLYQTDGDPLWYQLALELQSRMDAHFKDPKGGYFDNPDSERNLIIRPKNIQDNAVPSPNALAAMSLLLQSSFSDKESTYQTSLDMLSVILPYARKYPSGFAYWLCAIDQAVGPIKQITILGDPADHRTNLFRSAINAIYHPRIILAQSNFPPTAEQPELVNNRFLMEGNPTVYICENYTCQPPLADPESLKSQVKDFR